MDASSAEHGSTVYRVWMDARRDLGGLRAYLQSSATLDDAHANTILYHTHTHTHTHIMAPLVARNARPPVARLAALAALALALTPAARLGHGGSILSGPSVLHPHPHPPATYSTVHRPSRPPAPAHPDSTTLTAPPSPPPYSPSPSPVLPPVAFPIFYLVRATRVHLLNQALRRRAFFVLFFLVLAFIPLASALLYSALPCPALPCLPCFSPTFALHRPPSPSVALIALSKTRTILLSRCNSALDHSKHALLRPPCLTPSTLGALCLPPLCRPRQNPRPPPPPPQKPRQPKSTQDTAHRIRHAARPVPGLALASRLPAHCTTRLPLCQTLPRRLPTTIPPPTSRCPRGNALPMPHSTTSPSAHAPAA